MQETIEEEMRGGSFDSPTADSPSNHLGVPTDQVCSRPSDAESDEALTQRRDSVGALGYQPSSSPHRRTWSVACLRPLTDCQLTDRDATRSMPNVGWVRDAASAAKCVCDSRTSSADDGSDCRLADPDTSASRPSATAPHHHRPSVERPQRVSRSDPDMLKLPPSSSSKSNCHERREASRPSSLDRFTFRPQRQRSLPPRRDAPSLPVNVIFPTASRSTATVQL